MGDSLKSKTPALFEAFGRLVDSLAGRYITAEDVGTTLSDMVLTIVYLSMASEHH